MYSPNMRENLIKELNMQLEKNEFYKSDEIDISLDEIDTTHDFLYTNLASVRKVLPEINDKYLEKKSNLPYGKDYSSVVIKPGHLFKPLIYDCENPLNKNIYNYDETQKTAVNGLIYGKEKYENANNPLVGSCNIVNNMYMPSANTSIMDSKCSYGNNLDFDSLVESIDEECDETKIQIKPVARNTYNMADILAVGNQSQIINLSTVPDDKALVVQSKFRSFWFKQIDLFDGIKKLLHNNKVKAK